jgi:Bacterial membrane protein YfhO
MGVSGPKGAVFDERVGDEDLYRIPGSSDAVLIPEARGGPLPPADASGTPVAVDHPSPSSLRITTSNRIEQVLRLRVTDEPGWHATIDGQPLQLEPFSGVMFQARIPAGHHVIELHYWPTLFTVGLLVAGASVVLFVLFVVVSFVRRRENAESER